MKNKLQGQQPADEVTLQGDRVKGRTYSIFRTMSQLPGHDRLFFRDGALCASVAAHPLAGVLFKRLAKGSLVMYDRA